MQYFQFFRFLFPLAYLMSFISAAEDLLTVFNVKKGKNPGDQGSCDKLYYSVKFPEGKPCIETLKQYWEDTDKLVTNAREGLSKTSEKSAEGRQVRRNLQSWFGISFDKARFPKNKVDEIRLEVITSEIP